MRAQLLEKLGLKPDDLAGKVAVVTGAGQGIGKELTIALSLLGAGVVIAELKDTGAEVEAQIRAAGGKALFVKTDISDENSVRQLFDHSASAYGKADILVNNAVTIATGSVLELPVSARNRCSPSSSAGLKTLRHRRRHLPVPDPLRLPERPQRQTS